MQQKLALQIKLSQKLILTPSLQQAIKLLPMSTLELAEKLNQEITENPLLEEEIEVGTEETTASDGENKSQEKTEEKTDISTEEKGEEKQEDSFSEIDYESFFSDYLDEGYRPRVTYEVPDLPPIENTLASSSSLSDHLTWQLRLSAIDDLILEIGQAIIGNVDDDGYLQASVDEICAMGNYRQADVVKTLSLVQEFDPIGVGASGLKECLLIQIRHLNLSGTPAEKMVSEHMDLLHSHRFGDIAKSMGMSQEEVVHHCEVIRNLDPRPGSKYNPRKSHYVTPDVYVVKVDDKYEIVLNEDRLPQLRISSLYRRMLENKSADNEETRTYVKEKLRSALWLIKSVDQRQKTIYKVAASIVRQQKEFLNNGVEQLKPLVLRDVAMDIGMHESTVSRVVSNKYIHTPQGVCEMKYFFHSGIASTYGEAVSSVTIKQKIKKIIEEEDPKKPLSDSKIVKILEREGMMLARRTIAKYREEMRIPPSNQRKNLYSSPFANS